MRRPARTSRRRAQGGHSLLELMCALMVLAVGLLCATKAFYYGSEKLKAANEATVAARALQNEIEALRALPHDEFASAADRAFVSKTPELGVLVDVDAAVTISDADGGPEGLKQVTARVTWTGEHGRALEQSLTTLVADKGAP